MNCCVTRVGLAAAAILIAGCSEAKRETNGLNDRVLVIENLDSPVSMRIAKHYMSKRGVTKNLKVHCPDSAISNDGKFTVESFKSVKFAPGGIAETAVSTSGRTFLRTSDGGQSLVAELIDSRVTGVKGYCDEPFLPAIASPTILFDRYTQGWTLAESFYAASRFVGWEDIVIGDPLAMSYAR